MLGKANIIQVDTNIHQGSVKLTLKLKGHLVLRKSREGVSVDDTGHVSAFL